ncbi:MAG: hypothetical protein H6839_08605 [Planctomycetes bacterium]|nr:hypothetical protein [Planctomycetota bacterium]
MTTDESKGDAEERPYGENSAAVQAHVNLMQSVIQRMAANSNSCKAFCVTLVSAVLVVVADKGKPNLAFLALLPVVLFFGLDTYYLDLEQRFRGAYNAFIDKMHDQTLLAADLYSVHPKGDAIKNLANAMRSFSILPFYLTLLLLIALTWLLVLK